MCARRAVIVGVGYCWNEYHCVEVAEDLRRIRYGCIVEGCSLPAALVHIWHFVYYCGCLLLLQLSIPHSFSSDYHRGRCWRSLCCECSMSSESRAHVCSNCSIRLPSYNQLLKHYQNPRLCAKWAAERRSGAYPPFMRHVICLP